jgi:hypothetical protein
MDCVLAFGSLRIISVASCLWLNVLVAGSMVQMGVKTVCCGSE